MIWSILLKCIEKAKVLCRMVPGGPAFSMSNRDSISSALVEFLILVLGSALPFLMVTGLDWFAKGTTSFVGSIKEYSSAGELFFYVGTIIGTAFVLIRDNFYEGVEGRKAASALSESVMKRERTWWMLFLVSALLVCVVVLCVHHLMKGFAGNQVIWVSVFVYLTSLYFWFVSILYQKVFVSLPLDSGKKTMDNVTDALNQMGGGG